MPPPRVAVKLAPALSCVHMSVGACSLLSQAQTLKLQLPEFPSVLSHYSLKYRWLSPGPEAGTPQTLGPLYGAISIPGPPWDLGRATQVQPSRLFQI